MQAFNNNSLKESLDEMQKSLGSKIRQFPSYSFGDFSTCQSLIKMAMMESDKTIDEFKNLPELDEVAKWMTDTQGKGLFLTGDVGRGKTNIVMHTMPLLFFHFGRINVKAFRAEEVKDHLDLLRTRKLIAIDEMGVEPLTNNFGSKFESINRIFDWAEADAKILFISTNLNSDQVLERYGIRTLDRILRLCRVIKFEGDSLRR